MKYTRGERNNNPGNIRISSVRWQGEVTGKDKSFCSFSSPTMGIRALARVLLTYYRKYKLDTVACIIDRWAPTVENDTEAYVKSCCVQMCVDKDTPLKLTSYATLKSLVIAIIKHENGRIIYPDSIISDGVSLALGVVASP